MVSCLGHQCWTGVRIDTEAFLTLVQHAERMTVLSDHLDGEENIVVRQIPKTPVTRRTEFVQLLQDESIDDGIVDVLQRLKVNA